MSFAISGMWRHLLCGLGPSGGAPSVCRSHLINRRGCARAVRGAHGSERSEQRGRTPRTALVLWMASLFDLGGVAPRSPGSCRTDMLPVAPYPSQKSTATQPLSFMRWLLVERFGDDVLDSVSTLI